MEERGIKRRREKIVWFLFHAKYYSGNQIKINAMGGAWYAFSGEDRCIEFFLLLESLKERSRLEDLRVDWRKML